MKHVFYCFSESIVQCYFCLIYFKNITPERRADLENNPEKKVYLYNTELFQSINPFFVVLLTPVVVGFFRLLNRKGKEPHTPAKIAWGLVVSALSTFVMVAAVIYCHNGADKASAMWLFGFSYHEKMFVYMYKSFTRIMPLVLSWIEGRFQPHHYIVQQQYTHLNYASQQ